jgi:hypothetical protein
MVINKSGTQPTTGRRTADPGGEAVSVFLLAVAGSIGNLFPNMLRFDRLGRISQIQQQDKFGRCPVSNLLNRCLDIG